MEKRNHVHLGAPRIDVIASESNHALEEWNLQRGIILDAAKLFLYCWIAVDAKLCPLVVREITDRNMHGWCRGEQTVGTIQFTIQHHKPGQESRVQLEKELYL